MLGKVFYRRIVAIGGVITLSVLTMLASLRFDWTSTAQTLRGDRTVAEVLATIGADAEGRLRPAFDAAGVSYPPQRLTLLGLKEERMLELWADAGSGWRFIKPYPVLAASGGPGPKLREGDRQVPEGLYRIDGLNPNSRFHLSMKLNYPNAFDLERAEAEGRTRPGSDIFVHGRDRSVGCLAMGDPAIEELFVAVARTGRERVDVVLAPYDPRQRPLEPPPGAPAWTPELYAQILQAFAPFRHTGGSR